MKKDVEAVMVTVNSYNSFAIKQIQSVDFPSYIKSDNSEIIGKKINSKNI